MKTDFRITNITCDACIKVSSIALKKIPGVKNLEIKMDGQSSIESDRKISEKEITDALAQVEKSVSF